MPAPVHNLIAVVRFAPRGTCSHPRSPLIHLHVPDPCREPLFNRTCSTMHRTYVSHTVVFQGIDGPSACSARYLGLAHTRPGSKGPIRPAGQKICQPPVRHEPPGRGAAAADEEERVPRGYVPRPQVVAGGERVLVPVRLLSNPRVAAELLDMAAQRYGQPGVLRVPCDAGRFRPVARRRRPAEMRDHPGVRLETSSRVAASCEEEDAPHRAATLLACTPTKMID